MHLRSFNESRNLIMPSKCHKVTARWAPEPGSKAYDRENLARQNRVTGIIRSMGTKHHLHGSNCIHVRGRFSFQNRDRILPELVFKASTAELQCGACLNYLNR